MKHILFFLLSTFISIYAADKIIDIPAFIDIPYFASAQAQASSGTIQVQISPSITLFEIAEAIRDKVGPGNLEYAGQTIFYDNLPPIRELIKLHNFRSFQEFASFLEFRAKPSGHTTKPTSSTQKPRSTKNTQVHLSHKKASTMPHWPSHRSRL